MITININQLVEKIVIVSTPPMIEADLAEVIKKALLNALNSIQEMPGENKQSLPEAKGLLPLGRPKTVGELRGLLEPYGNCVSFGFRNQPLQELFEMRGEKGKIFVVFQ